MHFRRLERATKPVTQRMRSWPEGVLDLLIQAALSPAPQAGQAWRSWQASRRFEDVTWPEMRLLGALYPRLSELDPESPLRPRIDGILKHRWVLAQLKLNGACEAFDCLRAAGVSFMVFKGGAFHAEGFSSANRRVLGDIDILVHSRDALAALDALHREGWAAADGESLEMLRQLAAVRLNGNFRKGHHGNVDLHVSPFHYSRRAALDDLWARARPAFLVTRPILLPDPTDSILIVLAHAAESTKGDWAIDVGTRMREQDIDWDRLAVMANLLGIVPACLTGLAYLSRRVGLSVPDRVLARLSANKVPVSQRLKHWSNTVDRADHGLARKVTSRLADLMLDRQGFSREVKDRRAIAVSRSMIVPWGAASRRRSRIGSAPGLRLEHTVQLPRLDRQTPLVLQLTFEEPVRSRRMFFDVCVDGIAVARLKTRAGGHAFPRMITRRFRFRVPGSSGTLQISARPTHFLRPNATEAEIADFGQFSFQVDGVWIG